MNKNEHNIKVINEQLYDDYHICCNMEFSRIVGSAASVVGLFAMINNCIVIFVMYKLRNELLKINSIIYLFQQSIMDAFSGFCLLLTSGNLTQAFGYRVPLLTPGNVFHEYIICRLWMGYSFILTFTSASTFNLVLLTIERFIQVVHPLWHKRRMLPDIVKKSLVLPWMLGFFFRLPLAIYFGTIHDDGICYRESSQIYFVPIYAAIAYIMDLIMPLGIFIFCYVSILQRIKRISRTIRAVAVTQASGHKTNHWSGVERNTLKTMIIVCILFTVTIIAGQIITFLYTLNVISFTDEKVMLIPMTCIVLGSVVNPIIYMVQYRQVRNHFVSMLRLEPTNANQNK